MLGWPRANQPVVSHADNQVSTFSHADLFGPSEGLTTAQVLALIERHEQIQDRLFNRLGDRISRPQPTGTPALALVPSVIQPDTTTNHQQAA